MSEQNIVPIAKVLIGDEELTAATDVIRSGNLRQGKVTDAFEQAFADYVGAKHAIAVSSGTAALHVAYLAMIPEGSEVLVPSFSHISTVSMVCFANCTPVICDLDPETFLIDLNDAKNKLTAKTRAIVPVHLFGNSCDITAISQFAKAHDLKIVWDAAQAHGTQFAGKDIGVYPDAVTFSFYPTKNITTGEGGMIVTDDDAVAERCRLLRSHGQSTKYYHTILGLHYRITDMQSAIGLEQLKKLEMFIGKRRANGQFLSEQLAGIAGLTPQRVTPNSNPTYHQYTILVDEAVFGMNRDAFSEAMRARGIQTAVHYPMGLHDQPALIDKLGKQSLPVAERLTQQVISLPVHPALSTDELQQIVKAIRQVADMGVTA